MATYAYYGGTHNLHWFNSSFDFLLAISEDSFAAATWFIPVITCSPTRPLGSWTRWHCTLCQPGLNVKTDWIMFKDRGEDNLPLCIPVLASTSSPVSRTLFLPPPFTVCVDMRLWTLCSIAGSCSQGWSKTYSSLILTCPLKQSKYDYQLLFSCLSYFSSGLGKIIPSPVYW